MTHDPRTTTEKTVIGCLLTDSRAIDALVGQGGSASWFEDADCRRVATAILKRYETGRIASDVIAVGQDVPLPPQWYGECIDSIVTASHAPYYVGLLKGHADMDALNAMVLAIAHAVRLGTPETADESKAKIESILHRTLMQQRNVSSSMSAAAHAAIDRYTADDEHSVMLDWPTRGITDAVGRVDRELIWIVAQPSIGKTAFALQWMVAVARQGHISSLASLESSQESMAMRLISSTAPMDTHNIRQRRADLTEIAKARAAADAISDRIRVTDSGMSLDQVYSWGRAEVRAGSKLLIIDNTRHIRMPAGDRIQQMSEIAQRTKQLRDDTKTPVVVLHHSTIDQHGKEKASWSSDIEKDTDLMIFLRHDEKLSVKPAGPMDAGKWAVNFDVDKNREGRKFVRVGLEFDKPHQLFRPWFDAIDAAEDFDGETPYWEDGDK